MDSSGHIRDLKEFEEPNDNEIILNNKQAKKLRRMSLSKRKNWMRNKSCECGSGKKFKKCCWSSFARKGIK